MNVLLFLTPKSEVAYIYDDFTIRQALEKMEFHRFSAIPMINREGQYVGTLTEGDLLWYIKNDFNLDMKKAEETSIQEVTRHRDNDPVRASADLKDVFKTALNQNFIPIIDDNNVFIGIITRKNIFEHLKEMSTIQ